MSQPMRNELSFEEVVRARYVFAKHAEDKVTSEHTLRTMLSEIGQYPSQAELAVTLEAFDGKVHFPDFCKYLTFLKRGFLKPEDRDADTVRAFAALGGQLDRHGDINTDLLRQACQKFHLTIDIDAMILAVDDDQSGNIDYGEFKSLWEEQVDLQGAVSFTAPTEEPDEAEVLAQLREYLAAPKEKEQVVSRQPSMIKRKMTTRQSIYGNAAGRSSMLRLPAIASATAQPDQVAEEEEEHEVVPEEKKPAQTARTVTYDPAYRRYMMTDPHILGSHVKKAPSSARGPGPAPPASPRDPATPRGKSKRTPRSHRQSQSQSQSQTAQQA